MYRLGKITILPFFQKNTFFQKIHFFSGFTYSAKNIEKICRYSSGKYKEKGNINSIDAEILAVTYAIDSFRIFIIPKKEILIRIDFEVIVKFCKLKNEKRSSQRRWLNFTERIINAGVKIEIEHIKGKDNSLADSLRRLIN